MTNKSGRMLKEKIERQITYKTGLPCMARYPRVFRSFRPLLPGSRHAFSDATTSLVFDPRS